jgi:putative transferase (TIGR04331 family)
MITRPKVPQNINNLAFSKLLIEVLFPHLNKLHGINEDYNYWELLILPNIQLMSERLTDRFLLIKEGSVLINNTKLTKPLNNNDLIQDPLFWFSQSPENEELILIKITKFLEKSSVYSESGLSKQTKQQTFINQPFKVIALLLSLKRILRLVLDRYVSFPFRFLEKKLKLRKFRKAEDSDIFIVRDFLTSQAKNALKNKTKFIQSSDLAFYLADSNLNKFILKDQKKFLNFRNGSLNLSSLVAQTPELDLFIEFLEENLLSLLPAYCIEEFDFLRSFFKNINSQYIISDSMVFWDAISRHAIADQKSKGAQCLVFQHGGGFDIEYYDSFEKMEREFADKFFSWRESDDAPGIVSRKSLIIANKQFNQRKMVNPSIDVLILGPMFKDFHIYNNGQHPIENSKVANKLKNLINLLEQNGFSPRYRPYGWREDEISISRGRRLGKVASIHEEIINAKIVICCKPTTTVNDCLALGCHPILFFGDEIVAKDSVKNFFIDLGKEKFYFKDPQKCIDHILTLNDGRPEASEKTKEIFNDCFGGNIASPDQVAKIIEDFIAANPHQN